MFVRAVICCGCAVGVLCVLLSCTTTKGSSLYSPKMDIDAQVRSKNLDEAVRLYVANQKQLKGDAVTRAKIKNLLEEVFDNETAEFQRHLQSEALEIPNSRDFSFIDQDVKETGDFYAKITDQATSIGLEGAELQTIQAKKALVDALITDLASAEAQPVVAAVSSGDFSDLKVSRNFDKDKMWNDHEKDFRVAFGKMGADALVREYSFWSDWYAPGSKLPFQMLVKSMIEEAKSRKDRVQYLMSSQVQGEVLGDVILFNSDLLLEDLGRSSTKAKAAFVGFLRKTTPTVNVQPFENLLEKDVGALVAKDAWQSIDSLSGLIELSTLSPGMISQINERSRLPQNTSMARYKIFSLLTKENKKIVLDGALAELPDIDSYVKFLQTNKEHLQEADYSLPVFVTDLQSTQVGVGWPFRLVDSEEEVQDVGIEITGDSSNVKTVEETHKQVRSQWLAGTNMVQNPDYVAAKERLDKAKLDYEHAQTQQAQTQSTLQSLASNLGVGGVVAGAVTEGAVMGLAQNELNSAEANLENTPQQVPKDDVRPYFFQEMKTTLQKRTELSMTFRGIGNFGETNFTLESTSSTVITVPVGLNPADQNYKPESFSADDARDNFAGRTESVVLSCDTLLASIQMQRKALAPRRGVPTLQHAAGGVATNQMQGASGSQ